MLQNCTPGQDYQKCTALGLTLATEGKRSKCSILKKYARKINAQADTEQHFSLVLPALEVMLQLHECGMIEIPDEMLDLLRLCYCIDETFLVLFNFKTRRLTMH